MELHRAEPDNEHGAVKKLTLKISDHPLGLQKYLHRQWVQGQHCDLVLSAGACHLAVHSCVVSCFSTKISRHLLTANGAHFVSTDLNQYSVAEGGVVYCISKTGEKKVGLEMDGEMLKTLVGYMYTGCLSVPYCQTVALLQAAQLLGFDFVVNIIELFHTRNPDLVKNQRDPAAGNPPLPADKPAETGVAESRKQASHTTGHLGGRCLSKEKSSHCSSQSPAATELLKVNKLCGDVPVAPTAGLNIKQEVVDPELQELVDFSAQVEGSEGVVPTSNKLPLPDSQRGPDERESRGSEASGRKTSIPEALPVIKQERVDSEDFHDPVSHTREEPEESVSNFDSGLNVNFHTGEAENSSVGTERGHSSVQEETNVVFKVSSSKISKLSSASEKAESFTCVPCKKMFCSQARLDRHVNLIHKCKKNQQHICPQCDKQFDKKGDLKLHCRKVHRADECKVKGCNFKANNVGLLHRHMMRSHRRCFQCDHQAPNLRMLRKHREENHPNYRCPDCQQTFSVKKIFIEHQRTAHTNNSSVQEQQAAEENCSINGDKEIKPTHSATASTGGLSCSENAETATAEALAVSGLEAVLKAVNLDLVQNLNGSQESLSPGILTSPEYSNAKTLQHGASTGKGIQCRFCGNRYSKRKLNGHLSSSHAEKCFSCEQCPRCFVRKEGLTKHVYTKHKSQSWTCPHCDEVFSSADSYAAHCRAQHDDWKPFRCNETPSCHFRGNKLSTLEHHRENVHKRDQTFVCYQCRGCFHSQLYLSLHQRSCLKLEQHLCSYCGTVFSLRHLLISHIQVKHLGQRRYSCSQCGRRFSCNSNCKRHMRIHDNAFPYMCDSCGEKFRHSNTLKDHVYRKHGNKIS